MRNILIASCISIIFAVFVMPVPLQLASGLYSTIVFWAAVSAAVVLMFLERG